MHENLCRAYALGGDDTLENSDDRYDPLYKALDTTEEIDLAEAKLYKQFDRLKGVDNLGIIPLILKKVHYFQDPRARFRDDAPNYQPARGS